VSILDRPAVAGKAGKDGLADAYRSTDAGLPIQPIEPDAADPGRGIGWVEIADFDGSAKGTTAKVKENMKKGSRT
jgi:hypothetical protein